MDLLPQSRAHITMNPNRAASIDCIQASQAINARRRKSGSMSRSSQVTRQDQRRSFNSRRVLTGTDDSNNADDWQSLDHLITNPSIQCMQALERHIPGKNGRTEHPPEHITPQLSSRSHFCLLGESTDMPLAPAIVSRRKSKARTFYADVIVCGALNRVVHFADTSYCPT